MRLAIVCGLSDYKLTETLKPIQSAKTVQSIVLIRRKNIKIKGVKAYVPPCWLFKVLIFEEIWRFAKVFWICLRRRCDYVIGIHYRMHCVYAGLCGLLFNVPFVMMIVEDPRKYKEGFIFRFFVKRAHAITVRGHNSQLYLITQCGAKAKKVHVLRDPLELVCRGSDQRTYDFVFVGNMVQEKRPDILIDVFASLKKSGATFKAAIIGRGPLASRVERAIDENNLNDIVEYLGYVDDIGEYLNNAKCFIMTSQTEGMPTVLLEAFQYGLPAIVPDIGDITDVVEDGVNGQVVNCGDIDAYMRACQKILNDDAAYQTYCAGVRRFCSTHAAKYKKSTITRLWDNIFENITPS